ncbi:hypothetical protein ACFFIX_27440 [Metabacillus herbersteinensis]|uniref:Uncharacterized protein n=1 Tax=Metabacillus herbersteinensis TaxID=283816 RepID=A0ABV6GNP8_9BACI
MPKGKGRGRGRQGGQDNEGFPRAFLDQLGLGQRIFITYNGGLEAIGDYQGIQDNAILLSILGQGGNRTGLIERFNIDVIHSIRVL